MSKETSQSDIQKAIEQIDSQLLLLLSKRKKLSLEAVINDKFNGKLNSNSNKLSIEQQKNKLILQLIDQAQQHDLDQKFVSAVFELIINDNQKAQEDNLQQQSILQPKTNYRIAYLGNKGSYSHFAANRYSQQHNLIMNDVTCQTFEDIINKVETGQADYGFLPIENTSSGSINEVFDLLQHTSLMLVGETTIDVSHCLLAKAGTQICDIKTLLAHPQPISQCSHYLNQFPQLKLEYCASSAEAMKQVQMNDQNTLAAIGSAYGAQYFDLKVLKQNLANQKVNQTRFIIVAPKAVTVDQQTPAKTTLIITTSQQSGALVDALVIFKAHRLNMSKLESRPIIGKPWQEMFYLDIEVNLTNVAMVKALAELSKVTRFIKILGCYPIEQQL